MRLKFFKIEYIYNDVHPSIISCHDNNEQNNDILNWL